MKARIIETLIGEFAFDEDDSLIGEALYPKDADQIAASIRCIRRGELTTNLRELITRLKEAGVDTIAMINLELLEKISAEYEIKTETMSQGDAPEIDVVDLAVEEGYVVSDEDFGELSHIVNNQLAELEVHDALSKRESLLIPVVQLLGDLDTTLNSLSGRMREWYGVHFPELGRRVKDHEDYAKIILRFGDRKNIDVKPLQEMSFKKREAERITVAARQSIGAELDDDDVEAIQSYTGRLMDVFSERAKLTEYISGLTEEVAPNIAFLAGPVLGAKLIQKAGSLRRMAMMPSSTIQVLGAERAMFRTLKTRAKPPKHGLLFQHPYVHSAPRDKRGSRARSLAAKIAIAARADAFSGEFIAEELKKQLPEK
jgi:nucleolar protein 56